MLGWGSAVPKILEICDKFGTCGDFWRMLKRKKTQLSFEKLSEPTEVTFSYSKVKGNTPTK